MDPLKSVIAVSASGMRAQAARLRVVSENIANASSAPNTPGEDPYRRKLVTFGSHVDEATGASVVEVASIDKDLSDFVVRYEPSHPAADENGFVRYPNVNPLLEMSNMREASRSYEANMTMFENAREMRRQLIDLLK
ncbi:MAG: flagellar basal body rod protein FlgC [Alphaproteobacteria bacterium]|nr:MAG: flagellar basal body rod protein FlgC [Alphaproteobacteria bacterium]